jgi:glucosamine--fructose-6-phosphate aminotransferase (isomerizing)
MAITNVVGSTIAREADDLLYTWAGPEIAVASTKAYTTQIVAFGLVALDMGYKKGSIDDATYNEMIKAIKNLPRQTQEVLDYEEEIKKVAELIYDTTHAFYIGRGIDYNIAREGSLKLKEISYIHAEAMAAGELKHGTIALIERGTPVIALATEQALYEKVISNIKEVKARGAFVIAIAREGDTEIEKTADKVIYIPDTANGFSAVLSVMPLQLLAYHVAVMRECDVDKPRNLAKSVTVE